MSLNVSDITNTIGSLLPSGQDIAQNLLMGAATSVIVKGLQAGGANSLDPLGLFPKPAQPAAPIAPTNNPAVVSGPTVTASAFASLPASVQAALMAAGVHIVAG